MKYAIGAVAASTALTVLAIAALLTASYITVYAERGTACIDAQGFQLSVRGGCK